MTAHELKDAMRIAERAARTGGLVALHALREGVGVRIKPDGSPATDGDVRAEEAVRKVLESASPGTAILGEELGGESPGAPAAGTRWLIDPIDGTRNYIRGIPIFATLIGLEVDGVCTVGAAYAPAMEETVVAARGMGCFWNGRPARASSVSELREALLVFGGFDGTGSPAPLDRFLALVSASGRQRGFGDYYGHLLVATGRAEIMLEGKVHPWDIAPWKVILEEAGGRLTDLDGNDTIYGSSALGTNGILHDRILEVLRGDGRSS